MDSLFFFKNIPRKVLFSEKGAYLAPVFIGDLTAVNEQKERI